MANPLIILGCGYIGGRVARVALAQGREVRVCSRSAAHLEPLRKLGAEVHVFDATRFRQIGPALHGPRSPTVIWGVPPLPDVPPGQALQRATEAAINGGARAFIYLSSAGIYGDHPDETPIDEETPPAHDDPAMTPYQTDESAVQNASYAGLRTCILRLAAVYGPGKGVRKRMLAGEYKILDGGKHAISRVYIDDVVRIIFAAEERAPQSALYMVADDKSTTQEEYAAWLSQRLGLPMPPSQASYAPGMRRVAHRGRHIKNAKLKAELGITLEFPTYVEGELAIEREERGGDLPAPEPTAPRPANAVTVKGLKRETESNYPGRAEKHGEWYEVGEAVGLTHIGASFLELPAGQRASLPHAHSDEDELVYILEGTPDLWQDGHLHRLAPGDAVGWPAGTGIAHTLINNTPKVVRCLVVGERKPGVDRVAYPTDAARQGELKPERAWSDPPARERGAHPGTPEKR